LHLLQTLLGNWNGAFWGACVFSLHPLQVESVAWASETKGLLAALLGFLAILILQRHRTGAVNPKAEALACELRAGDSTAGNKRLCYALASGCFLLALLSKPSAVAIPLIVIAIDKLWWQVPWRRTLAVSAPWLVVAAAFVLVTRGAQAVSLPAFSPPWWARLLIAGDTIAFYLAKLVWPWRLGFDYGRDPQTVLNGDWVYAACLIPAALALLAAGRSRLRPFGTALAIFLAGMSPVLGLTSFAFQKYSTVADRYMYIPMLGAAFWVAWLMTQHGSQRIWRALSFLLLGMLALQSVRQISVWHDTLTLAAHGLQVNPISTPANCFYGTSLKGAGKYAEAVKYFSQACKTHPDDIVSRLDLASCLIEIGDLEEAQRQIKEAQARWPPVLEVMPERKAEFEAAMARKRRADSTTGPVEAHLP
jgi:hypothetical protein